tara:strand:- start:248 stop:580 length:333 start_codon:yes stop_codon:yes gene_type:complete
MVIGVSSRNPYRPPLNPSQPIGQKTPYPSFPLSSNLTAWHMSSPCLPLYATDGPIISHANAVQKECGNGMPNQHQIVHKQQLLGQHGTLYTQIGHTVQIVLQHSFFPRHR